MDGKSSYQDVNAKTVNRWVDEGWEWGRPVDHEAFVRARDGNPQIRLTPTKAMPTSWWPKLVSTRVLGLASGYEIDIVHADMTKPLPFADESFDLVVNPVSLVFVREVEPIWREVARVLCPGGILVSGLDTGINYIVDDTESSIVHGLPFDPIAEPELAKRLAEEDGGMQFSHTLEESLGGLLRAGFTIDDLYEDTNGEGRLHDLGIPSYIAVRATRLQG